MAVYGIFGQNGVGKDAVLKRVQEIDPHILIVKSTKVLMKALGYPANPLSKKKPPREWYLCLERLSFEKAKNLVDTDLRYYFEVLDKQGVRVLATLHLALLKKSPGGISTIYMEEIKSWYKEVFKGAIRLKADIDSIWSRRQTDLDSNRNDKHQGKNRGDFSKREVAAQLEACDQVWDVLAKKQFNGHIPHLVLDNSNSILGREKKIDKVAHELVGFINGIECS